MKNGKLNKRERDTLCKARTILSNFCDWEIDARMGEDGAEFDDAGSAAASAACLIRDFIYWHDQLDNAGIVG